MTPLGGVLVAVGFLTRIPIPRPEVSRETLAWASVWFPVVGVLVGAVIGGVRLVADLALPVGPATLLGVLAGIWLTGGLHEDGLADVVDGMGAHVVPERRLEIMRDPHVGTFGILALIGAVGLSWSVLAELSTLGALLAAVTAHAVGRWTMVYAAWSLPPVDPDSTGAQLRPDRTQLALGTAAAVAIGILAAGPGPGLLSVGLGALVVHALGRVLARRLGGANGDVLGALGVVAILLVLGLFGAVWS